VHRICRANLPIARERRLGVRVAEQTIILPSLSAATALFALEHSFAAVQAVAANGD
jgi:hypothetical protein